LSKSSAAALGIDWCISPGMAREFTGNRITLQGNFDPAKLLLPISQIKKEVHEMIRAFGVQNYIVNLGHGITPNIPVSHAKAFVESVKDYCL
jgi:uroporphyrinogen decarboxylase